MKYIYHSTSEIHGLGVRAGEHIRKGSIITRFQGPAKFKINKNKRDAMSHPNWVGIGKHTWIEPSRPQKFINHSCEPSAGVRGLTVVALIDIREGEEITIDYSTIEGDIRWEMKCSCNSQGCRGVISSVESLTWEQFERIAHIPSYFRKLYLNSRGKRNEE